MSAEATLWEIVEQAAKSVTDPLTGRFENKALIDEVRSRLNDDDLPAHVRAWTLEMLARSLATGFVSRRNPRPRPNGLLFNPGAVLPLGDGKRVWMEQATDSDLLAWAQLSTANLSRVAIAEGTRQKYAADRLAAFRDHPGWTLGQIEREVFGFTGEDVPDEYGDEPEDGDWP